MSDQPPVKKAKEESSLDADLIAAARSNDFEKVSKLLEDGADAAFQEEESGTSVLMAAAENKNIKMIKLLLENGAPWNALDRKHECAGDYAVKTGDQVRKIGTLVAFYLNKILKKLYKFFFQIITLFSCQM